MAGFNRIDSNRETNARTGIGVVGYGFMGKVHSNAYLKIPYSFKVPAAFPRLYAMCGRNAAKTEETARGLGYEGWYSDWKGLVRDPAIQIVDVCTPDNEHAAPSIAAAEAGKHVICEKPLAMTVAEARSMADAAAKGGVKNMLCHNYRFLPAVRLARNLVDSGMLGTIYHFRAVYLQEIGHDPASPVEDCWYASGTRSGVLLGIGSHIIDMARFLVGEVRTVSGLLKTFTTSRKNLAGKSETITADEGNAAIVEFDSGAIGTLESSGVATGRKNGHMWEINGSKGSISYDLEDPDHLQVLTDGSPKEIRGFANVSVTSGGHPFRMKYFVPGCNPGWEYGHVHALHHFLDCVVNDKPVAPYGAAFEDGYRIQVIMKAIADSSASGRRIVLEF
jgi:predicted dehydrogenase